MRLVLSFAGGFVAAVVIIASALWASIQMITCPYCGGVGGTPGYPCDVCGE